jgi:hypothetical protein
VISLNGGSMAMAAANGDCGRIRISVILAGKKASHGDLLTADTLIADTECTGWRSHTPDCMPNCGSRLDLT